MKVRVRERRSPAERRAQILDEAIRFLGERGYHGFTIQALASRCGITNGALLHYFESKERLLAEVLAEYSRREVIWLEAFAVGMATETENQQLSPTAIIEFFRMIMVRTAAEPELEKLAIVLQSESMESSHPAHGFFQDRERMVIEGFTQLLEPHFDDAPALAREVFAMMDGLTLRWLHAGQSFDLVKAWQHAARKIVPTSGHNASEATRSIGQRPATRGQRPT